MAANLNRPIRSLRTSAGDAVDLSTPQGDEILTATTCGMGHRPVKQSRHATTNLQLRRESNDSDNTNNPQPCTDQFGTLPGISHTVLQWDGADIAGSLESHHNGRALMQAMRTAPEPQNAATPTQARALATLVGAIFLAFLIGWTFFGLPAPELPR